ncbi:MAG TPA: hypothetical protein VLM11_09550 [Streptosporangiaceae bacterium]|nr:hypothetical protein [Streptosporangiaceae bacterium]
MSTGIIAVLIVAAFVSPAGLAAAAAARRRRLDEQFGAAKDQAVTAERARRKYGADWAAIQAQYAAAPQTAAARAYELVVTVLTERGYLTDDTGQVRIDLSADHADTVSHFRAAQQITTASAAGAATIDDLRQALIHYRELFSDLFGESAAVRAAER